MFFCAVEEYDSLLSITTEKLSTKPKLKKNNNFTHS